MTGANRGENLAAGDSYTATRNINLGRNIDIGNQYLLFVTDYYDYEEESNETNNILAVPIAIDAPNLVVESTISPTSVISGETVELSWTVNNNGDVQTSRGWYDYIYLSDDDTLDSTDTQLTGQWTNSPLAAGDSYTVTRNVNFGTNIDIGNQYLLFAIDRFNYQGETDETDNVKAVPIQIEAPNLTISGTPTVQSSAALGETISLEYTVSNNGSVTAPADWWDFFYISDDAILDSSDISIGSRYTYSDTPLAAGDSYTATRDFTISNNVGTGNKYLLVETDRYNNQGETDETDNVKAIEIEIGAPNLTISETPTAPTSAILGETISLEYTVSNNGSVKAPSDWYDYFYISDDAIFDSSDINIGSRYAGNDTPLAAGDSYSATYDVTISNNVGTGNKYLLVAADGNNRQGETDETDNVTAVEIEIGAPNLTISETPTAPTSAVLGETISLEYTVTNNGTFTAPRNWWDGFYISDDAILDSSDISIGSRNTNTDSPLAAGDSYTATYDVTISNNVGTGNKYLLVETDRYNYQGETDETDNVKAIEIEIGAPNLTISETPTVPSSAALGERISIEYTVSNNGTVTAPSDWWDFFYISDDAILDSSDRNIGSRYTNTDSPLAAGDSYSATYDVTISNNVGTGNKYLLVAADGNNRQGETDETDNVKAIPIQIGAANLTISETPTIPTSAALGETISLEYTVTNNGTVTAPSDWYDYPFFITSVRE